MVSCPSSYTLPAYVWAALSILSAVLCPFGLYFSNWLEKESNTTNDGTEVTTYSSMSSFRYCKDESSQFSTSCDSYYSFGEIYSIQWKATTLLMGVGACFLVLVALTSIFGFCVKRLFNVVVVVLTVIFQTMGVVLYTAGILVFPAGFDAEEVKNMCGDNSSTFHMGDCEIGWALYLIIIGTAIGVVATCMAWTTHRWRDKEEDYSV